MIVPAINLHLFRGFFIATDTGCQYLNDCPIIWIRIYLPTHLPAYLPICLSTYLSTGMIQAWRCSVKRSPRSRGLGAVDDVGKIGTKIWQEQREYNGIYLYIMYIDIYIWYMYNVYIYNVCVYITYVYIYGFLGELPFEYHHSIICIVHHPVWYHVHTTRYKWELS